MKRAMVYILTLTLAFSALLSGCGERDKDQKPAATARPQSTAAPTASPEPSLLPESMMPDPEDGVVKDDDGIITDDDTGSDSRDDNILTGENAMDPDRKEDGERSDVPESMRPED